MISNNLRVCYGQGYCAAHCRLFRLSFLDLQVTANGADGDLLRDMQTKSSGEVRTSSPGRSLACTPLTPLLESLTALLRMASSNLMFPTARRHDVLLCWKIFGNEENLRIVRQRDPEGEKVFYSDAVSTFDLTSRESLFSPSVSAGLDKGYSR